MSKIFGEAVPTPNGPTPFAAVFYSGEREISRYEAQSKQEAESAIVEMLGKLATFVRSETGGDA